MKKYYKNGGNTRLKIKVCGMRDPDNIADLLELPIEYIGFIFHPKSPRYMDDSMVMTNAVKRTGVFVDAPLQEVQRRIETFLLDAVQLHGKESPEYCIAMKARGLEVIKAFSVGADFDFQETERYEGAADYFLFDTKTALHGGSGVQFDWEILNYYHGQTPFFLSGGIGLKDADKIKAVHHPKLYALDLNSRFEISPALKDIHQLTQFLKAIHID